MGTEFNPYSSGSWGFGQNVLAVAKNNQQDYDNNHYTCRQCLAAIGFVSGSKPESKTVCSEVSWSLDRDIERVPCRRPRATGSDWLWQQCGCQSRLVFTAIPPLFGREKPLSCRILSCVWINVNINFADIKYLIVVCWQNSIRSKHHYKINKATSISVTSHHFCPSNGVLELLHWHFRLLQTLFTIICC